MRVVITEEEYLALKKIQSAYGGSHTFKVVFDLVNKIETEKIKPTSTKKQKAMTKATEKRSKEAKEKIMNAINILKLYGGGISVNAVAKEAGVSYNTAKKYKKYMT